MKNKIINLDWMNDTEQSHKKKKIYKKTTTYKILLSSLKKKTIYFKLASTKCKTSDAALVICVPGPKILLTPNLYKAS